MIGVNLLKIFFNNYQINIKSFNIKNIIIVFHFVLDSLRLKISNYCKRHNNPLVSIIFPTLKK